MAVEDFVGLMGLELAFRNKVEFNLLRGQGWEVSIGMVMECPDKRHGDTGVEGLY